MEMDATPMLCTEWNREPSSVDPSQVMKPHRVTTEMRRTREPAKAVHDSQRDASHDTRTLGGLCLVEDNQGCLELSSPGWGRLISALNDGCRLAPSSDDLPYCLKVTNMATELRRPDVSMCLHYGSGVEGPCIVEMDLGSPVVTQA
ncbi:hypothetical protein Bbelb_203990 [Branchiostoma belcheri]|nr:hypothetical protein Bbelb_203990 [Branchiostoma belcheri]